MDSLSDPWTSHNNISTPNKRKKAYKRAITFGTYDLFHVGHVRLLQRAAELADDLYVGVSTDELNMRKKQKTPVFSFKDRFEIVSACKGVTHVFAEDSLELKRDYITKANADVLVMGDDWEGKFDDMKDICDVVYLSRTEDISTTDTLKRILTKTNHSVS